MSVLAVTATMANSSADVIMSVIGDLLLLIRAVNRLTGEYCIARAGRLQDELLIYVVFARWQAKQPAIFDIHGQPYFGVSYVREMAKLV